LSRPASDPERDLLSRFLDEQAPRYRQSDAGAAAADAATARKRALADLCHLLMSCNEFAYVD